MDEDDAAARDARMGATRRRDAWPLAAACVVFPILGLTLRGYRLVYQDNARWIAAILETAHPGPLAGEAVLRTPEMSVGGLVPILGAIARHAGVAWPFFALHLVAACGASAMLALVARRLGAGRAAVVLTVALLSRGVYVGKAATLTLEAMFLPRALALVPGLGAVHLALAGRPLLAGLVTGVAISINPLTGGCFGMAAMALILVHPDRRRGMPRLIAGAAATGGWVVLAWALQQQPIATTVTDAEWLRIVRVATMDIVSWPDAWDWMWVFPAVSMAALLAGAALGLAARDVLAIALSAVVAIGIGAAAITLESVPLLGLQFPRGAQVMMLVSLVAMAVIAQRLFALGRAASALGAVLALCAIATWYGWLLVLMPIACVVAASGLPRRPRVVLLLAAAAFVLAAIVFADLAWIGVRETARLPWIAASALAGALLATRLRSAAAMLVFGVACVGAVVAIDGPAPGDWPWRGEDGPSAGLHRWARATPESTRFALFPPEDGFRALARRRVALEPQDAPPTLSGRAYAQAWWPRFQVFGTERPGESAIAALEDGTLDVIAVRRRPAGPPLPFPIAWQDGTWIALVREGSPLLHGARVVEPPPSGF